MVVQLDAQLGGALRHVLPVHARGEGGLLELLAHALRLERREPLGSHGRAGADEAGELVAGVQRVLELALAAHLDEVIGVREHRADEPFGIAELTQHGSSVLRVAIERRMPLVVEVVQ